MLFIIMINKRTPQGLQYYVRMYINKICMYKSLTIWNISTPSWFVYLNEKGNDCFLKFELFDFEILWCFEAWNYIFLFLFSSLIYILIIQILICILLILFNILTSLSPTVIVMIYCFHHYLHFMHWNFHLDSFCQILSMLLYGFIFQKV
jgi:hypothetical protein